MKQKEKTIEECAAVKNPLTRSFVSQQLASGNGATPFVFAALVGMVERGDKFKEPEKQKPVAEAATMKRPESVAAKEESAKKKEE